MSERVHSHVYPCSEFDFGNLYSRSSGTHPNQSEGCTWGMQLGGRPMRLFDQVKTDSWHSRDSGRTQATTYWNYRLIWFLCSRFGTPLHNQIPLHGHGSVLTARHAGVCHRCGESEKNLHIFQKHLFEKSYLGSWDTETVVNKDLFWRYPISAMVSGKWKSFSL